MGSEIVHAGCFYKLMVGGKCVYKSKDRAKVESRLVGQLRSESNLEERRSRARYGVFGELSDVFRRLR